MSDQDELRRELAEVEELLAGLAGQSVDTAPDAARDAGDAGLELTERMELDGQIEALTRRRDSLREKLGD